MKHLYTSQATMILALVSFLVASQFHRRLVHIPFTRYWIPLSSILGLVGTVLVVVSCCLYGSG